MERFLEEVLNLVAGYCTTAIGERTVLSLRPDHRRAKVDFGDIAAALSEWRRGMSLSLPMFPNMEDVFSYLERYGTLNGEKVYTVALFVEKVLSARERIHSNRLARHLNVPNHLIRLSREIKANLTPSGKVRMDKHSTLSELVRRRNQLRERLLALYSEVIKKHAEKLRERQPVIKGGRLSLAVISNFKIDGIVHGYSATTETVFVEPYEVAPLQNDLVRVEEQIKEYEERVVKNLSHRVLRNMDIIRRLYESIGRLDSVFARAKYSIEYGCTIPKFGKALRLKGAFEPVLYRLKGEKTVPIDLNPQRFALLITGPNAGGKTVTLRTVAFAVLMSSLGIPVPAQEVEVPEGSRVFPLGFESETDVEEGLSGFTGELKRLKVIVESARGGDVVLFDEVFASTDPDEASALAYSTAKFLSDRGIYVLMSTHFSTLKALALESDFFDVATMENYRLVFGRVGHSEGLKAARAFLPPEIVSHAQEVLKRIPSYISRLRQEYEEKLKKLEREREEVRKTLHAVRRAISRGGNRAEVEGIFERVKGMGDGEISPGKEYFVKSLGLTAKVVDVRGKKAIVKVRNFTVEVPLEDIIP